MLEENWHSVRRMAVFLRTLRIKGVIEDFALLDIPSCENFHDVRWTVKGRELEVLVPGLLVQIGLPGATSARRATRTSGD